MWFAMFCCERSQGIYIYPLEDSEKSARETRDRVKK